MSKGKKLWAGCLLVLVMLLGTMTAFAAETKEINPLQAESMEIRTASEGKLGLRSIFSIDESYLNELKEQGKTVEYGTIAVPASAMEADKGKGDLQIGISYMLKGKSYAVMQIPAEKNWKIENGRVYFTGVLTGISGAGFNTRYAVRPYVTVDGTTTYGDTTMIKSSYTVAQEMAADSNRTEAQRAEVVKTVIDVCDDTKKVTQEQLNITNGQLTNGAITVEGNDKLRNYKEVVIDSSVQNATITLKNVRVRKLVVAEDASVTIQAENVIFDEITNASSESRVRAAANNGTFLLQLIGQTALPKLDVTRPMEIKGTVKIGVVQVQKPVAVVIENAVGKLEVSETAGGSTITANGSVDDAVINGNGSTIDGDGSIGELEDNGANNNVEVEVEVVVPQNSIVSVEVKGFTRMIVTLEQPSEKPYTKDDMAILCAGGSEMTVVNATTKDNRVYEVTTSVFAKDDTFTFSIEIAPGKVIQKEFYYNANCPMASNATVLRSEATRAEFDLFDVDEGGYVYFYIPGHTQVSRKAAVAAANVPTIETVKKGTKQPMATGFNKVIIKGLEEGISYDLYYVLEAYDGRTSNVHGPLKINGTVQEDPNLSKKYEIVSVEEKPANTITIRLNQAPEEQLTIQNFSFICPAESEITLDEARLEVSSDRLTYKIVIPENYGHKDNQYTAKITFSDGTVAKKNFRVHFNPPMIMSEKIERIAEDKIKFSFTSDEPGTFYIGTFTWNHAGDWENNTPKADDVISGKYPSTKATLRSGNNEIELSYNGTDKDIFVVYVDEAGNYQAGYAWSVSDIPNYVPPVEPEPDQVQIKSIEATVDPSAFPDGTTTLKITFTKPIDDVPWQDFYTFTAITGDIGSGKLMISSHFPNYEDKTVLSTTIGNRAFKKGSYKVKILVFYNNEPVYVEKEFTIN